MFPKSVHAVTSQGFELKVALFVIAYSLNCYHRPIRSNLGCLYRAVAILMLNTLIVYACFELAAIGVFKIASVISKPTTELVGEGLPREKVSYYASQEWAQQYWYDLG